MFWAIRGLAAGPAAEQRSMDGFAVADETEVGIRNYRAVLFAAWDYAPDSGIGDLQTPATDVNELAEILRDQYGFEVTVFEHATEEKIRGELYALSSLPADTALLLYYSGHGWWDDEERRGYWFPEDATRNNPANWVANDDILAALKRVKAGHVLLVSDSCFSGLFTRDAGPGDPADTPEDAAEARMYTSKVSRRFISSGGNEPVLDLGCDGMSVFSCNLARQLRTTTERYVIPDTYFKALAARVYTDSNGRQTPSQNDLPDDQFGQLVMINRHACPETIGARHDRLESAAHAAWVEVSQSPDEASVAGWIEKWGVPSQYAACGNSEVFLASDSAIAQQWLAAMRGGELRNSPPPMTTEELGITMVRIAAGAFVMGSSPAEQRKWAKAYRVDPEWFGDEEQHPVTLRHDYWLADKEVNQGQIEVVLGYNPATTKPQFWDGVEHGPCDSMAGKLSLVDPAYPAVCVTWVEAAQFANAVSQAEGLSLAYTIDGNVVTWDRDADGYRLPTEAEWEYAARAGTTTPWGGPTGSDRDVCALGNVADDYAATMREDYGVKGTIAPCRDGASGLARVGSYPRNPYGIYDMVGNAREWTWDAYAPYESGAAQDPSVDVGDLRVYRGGGWNNRPAYSRAADRFGNRPDSRNRNQGFRLARSVH